MLVQIFIGKNHSNIGRAVVLITDQGQYFDSVNQYEQANALMEKKVCIISIAVGSSWIIPTFVSQFNSMSTYKPFETSYSDLNDKAPRVSELICSGKLLITLVTDVSGQLFVI